jgi:Sec-independent protein translocase protein TatA
VNGRNQMMYKNEEIEKELGLHLSEEELLRYCGGSILGMDLDRIQCHLVDCDECLDLFKHVRDFCEPQRDGEAVLSEQYRRDGRDAFRREMAAKETSLGRHISPVQVLAQTRDRRFRYLFAGLAASLIVLVAILLFWNVKLRNAQKEMAVSFGELNNKLKEEQAAQTTRMNALEQANRELEDKYKNADQKKEGEANPAHLPTINNPIYDIYAVGSKQRSSTQNEVNEISVPSDGTSIVLILNGQGQSSFSSYALEIEDQKGQIFWKASNLKRNQFGNFVLTVNKAFLNRGTYRIRILNSGGPRNKPTGEYLIRVK